MIDDLSRSLRVILDDPGLATSFPELADAQISFERPSETFNPAQTTIDLFLYDVRENVELRDNTPSVTRLNDQVAIGRPPLRVACSYLVTAWPVGGIEPPLQEHRLLSQALQVFSALPTIPPGFLQGCWSGRSRRCRCWPRNRTACQTRPSSGRRSATGSALRSR
jgi:Pvc16 N-terminal domain